MEALQVRDHEDCRPCWYKAQFLFFDFPVFFIPYCQPTGIGLAGYAPEDNLESSLGQMKKFSIREMQIATNNFSSKNVIGAGGFGKVYVGSLVDGTKVAVKRLNKEKTPGGEASFQTEVEIISMALHRNLLRLLVTHCCPTYTT